MENNYTLKTTHITQIKQGDTIIHNGRLTTVCKNDIKKDNFIGVSIFGASYPRYVDVATFIKIQ